MTTMLYIFGMVSLIFFVCLTKLKYFKHGRQLENKVPYIVFSGSN